ncbi:MAG: hypothetical protein LBR08_04625 [Bacteroidales bacterium]|jgi:ligand-binding sensor domain-containing protein|nr:hypothetical protein [Bacteroidales bacterium]
MKRPKINSIPMVSCKALSLRRLAGFVLAMTLLTCCVKTPDDLLDPAQAGVWTHYTTSDGLPGNRVSDIALDSNGVLWAAFPEKGIARYNEDDGSWTLYDTHNIHLPSLHVTCLEPDGEGNIYIGTDIGFFVFTPATEKLTGKNLSAYVTCIKVISKDRVRIGSSNGTLWDNYPALGGYTAIPFSSIVQHTNLGLYAFEPDSEGRIWMGTSAGLWLDTGQSFDEISAEDFPAGIRSFLTDSRQRMWIGAANQRTVNYTYASEAIRDGRFISAHSLLAPKIASGNIDIRDIYEDRQGNIWFATHLVGAIKFDNYLTYQMNVFMKGFPEKQVNAIAGDRHGNIWFGLNTKGLVKYTPPLE